MDKRTGQTSDAASTLPAEAVTVAAAEVAADAATEVTAEPEEAALC